MQPGSNSRRVTITNASVEIIPPSEQRIGLLFPASRSDNYWISFGGDAVVDEGFLIPVGTTPFKLHVDQWGCLVKRAINAICAAGPLVVQVVELFDYDRPKQYGNNPELIQPELDGGYSRTVTPQLTFPELKERNSQQIEME